MCHDLTTHQSERYIPTDKHSKCWKSLTNLDKAWVRENNIKRLIDIYPQCGIYVDVMKTINLIPDVLTLNYRFKFPYLFILSNKHHKLFNRS